MVEYLTGDQGAAGVSLTGVTALWSLSKTHLSYPHELVTTFFYEKVGVCICKHRQYIYKSKYRPTFLILRVCD